MNLRSAVLLGAVVAALCAAATPARAQKSVAELMGRPGTPEGQPKTYLEELMIWGYLENSYVFNLGDAGRHKTNALRFYDADEGYTFNAAEISLADGADPQRILEATMGKLRIRRFELAAPSLEEIFIEQVGAETMEAIR